MEEQEKVGEVLRSPFGALKKACEENSIRKVINGGFLINFERITDSKMNERKGKEQKTKNKKENEQRPLFTEETQNEVLYKNKEDREER